MSQNAEDTPADLDGQLPLRMYIPDELRAASYANRVVISLTPSECIITFAQLPPLRDEAALDEARAAGHVDTVAVANVAIGHEFLPRIIEIFQDTLARFEEQKSKKEESE